MNDSGEVVGMAASSYLSHGFYWNPNTGISDLGEIGMNVGAYLINNTGYIFGWSATPIGSALPFMFSPSRGFLLPPGLATFGTVTGLNDAGTVVGFYSDVAGKQYPFLYDGTGLHDLIARGMPLGSTPYAINTSGQIAGQTSDAKPMIFSNNTMTLIKVPGGIGEAVAMNNLGAVAGDYRVSGNISHAFMTRPQRKNSTAARVIDLKTLPGGLRSMAEGINDWGEVVGRSEISPGNYHAFVYLNGKMRDLNTMVPTGSTETLLYAHTINDRGQILVEASRPGHGSVTYVLTPKD